MTHGEGAGHAVAERRLSRRHGALRGAQIVFRNGYCTIGCQIVNESESGARLIPADLAQCPSEFVLKPREGEARRCVVVWRRGAMVGVRFIT
jgi:hypothetical protein